EVEGHAHRGELGHDVALGVDEVVGDLEAVRGVDREELPLAARGLAAQTGHEVLRKTAHARVELGEAGGPARGPQNRASCAGSVKARNTRSGGAASSAVRVMV